MVKNSKSKGKKKNSRFGWEILEKVVINSIKDSKSPPIEL